MQSSSAIIIRHDSSPSQYEISTADYPAVFYLERQGDRKICVATIIHYQWAITAAHCADQTSLNEMLANESQFEVQVNGQARVIDSLVVHPDFNPSASSDVDLALIRFSDRNSLPRPMLLQLEENELGAEVSILGWGYFGIGTIGRQYSDGEFRRATNRISAANSRLQIVFDDPRVRNSSALKLEGLPSLGDSGGPALIRQAGVNFLAGVAVGEIEDAGFTEESQGDYGSTAVYERVSQHLDWIKLVIGEEIPFAN